MSKPRQTQHFAEIEYCLQNYFNSQLAPVMKEAQTYLTQKQVEEIGAYHASTAGVLRSLANGANGMPDDSLPYLRQTGEWNSKTTEDYVAMCRERIAATPETVEDLSLLAGEWRNAVVAEIGREQYEELSKELGGDLAFAYVDYRVEQMMIDRMAVEQMPKSSVEYILRKGAEGSLLGLAQGMMKSPLQQEIERRGEAAYRPSGAEKAWGTAVGVGMDTVMMGGISSWGSLIKLGGVEAVSYAVGKFMDGTEDAPAMTVEDCISRGVFGSEHNVFADFRAQGKVIKSYENPYILSLNERLAQKMGILTEKPLWAELMEAEAQVPHGWPFPAYEPPSNERKPGHGDVPMVVAPGREEEYLAMMQEEEEKERVETAKRETEKTATEFMPKARQKLPTAATSILTRQPQPRLLPHFMPAAAPLSKTAATCTLRPAATVTSGPPMRRAAVQSRTAEPFMWTRRRTSFFPATSPTTAPLKPPPDGCC